MQPTSTSVQDDRTSWRRRLIRLAGRMGVRVADLRPGAVVVSRSTDYAVTAVSEDSYLVRRADRPEARRLELRPGLSVLAEGGGRRRVRRERLGEHLWVVGPTRAPDTAVGITALGAAGWVVGRTGTGADLRVEPLAGGLRLARADDPKTGSRLTPIGKVGWLLTPPTDSPDAERALQFETTRLFGMRHIAWLLERNRIDCVLDVGANVGQYGLALRKAGYAGHVISFEPVPEFLPRLEAEAADDPRWHVRTHALGRADEEIDIYVQRSFSSVLRANEYGRDRFKTLREMGNSAQVRVPLHRLDTVWDEMLAPVAADLGRPPRVYLKMDTQGFDLEVFAGLGDRTADILAMQSELALLPIYDGMPSMTEALATYAEGGFAVTGFFPVNQEPDGRIIEYDCTLVRRV